MAEAAELDLVEVAPQAKPPVCRIMNYGKYRFQQQKRDKDARKKQKNQVVKEIKMRPKIDLHDYASKFALCGLPVVKVGINFDSEKRTLGDWKIENEYSM